MALGIRILSDNLSGLTTNVTFLPQSGGTISLGTQVFPFNYISDYVYGTYNCYVPTYGYTYSLDVLAPTPTPTVTSTSTPTPTTTITPTQTSTPTQTPTNNDTPTPTPTNTSTPTQTRTNTETSTPTPTNTSTPTNTPTPTTTPGINITLINNTTNGVTISELIDDSGSIILENQIGSLPVSGGSTTYGYQTGTSNGPKAVIGGSNGLSFVVRVDFNGIFQQFYTETLPSGDWVYLTLGLDPLLSTDIVVVTISDVPTPTPTTTQTQTPTTTPTNTLN